MKPLSKNFLLLLTLPLLCFACSGSHEEDGAPIAPIEEIRDIELSIAEKDWSLITTNEVDYEFEILDGNGGYTATVSATDGEPHAKVTIEGKKVTVNLLMGNFVAVEITIADQKNQKAILYITSTHPSLDIPEGHTVFLDKGQTYLMDYIEFGAGAPYTLQKVRGDAAHAQVEEGGIRVKSLAIGDTYYKLRDKRGSVTRLTVQTTLQYEMAEGINYLEIEGVNNLTATVAMLYGDRWEIISSTDKVTENLSVGYLVGRDILFVHTVDEGKGTDTITLKDKNGKLAVVDVKVR